MNICRKHGDTKWEDTIVVFDGGKFDTCPVCEETEKLKQEIEELKIGIKGLILNDTK